MTNDITPKIDSKKYPNYVFHVEIVSHRKSTLTRAFHPDFYNSGTGVPTLNDLQQSYHNGTALLARDNDLKIADNDARVNTPTAAPYQSDDAPAYAEFIIENVPFQGGSFPSLMPFLPMELWDPRYFFIIDEKDLNFLLNRATANINQVHLIFFQADGETRSTLKGGATLRGKLKTAFPETPTAIPNPDVVVHEWLHSLGVVHRNQIVQGTIPNPGPVYRAVMNFTNSPINTMINRYERSFINP